MTDISDQSLRSLEELQQGEALDLLQNLPEHQRDAIRAHVIEEIDYDELAESAHVSQAVVRKRVSRGLATLRRRLDHEGERP